MAATLRSPTAGNEVYIYRPDEAVSRLRIYRELEVVRLTKPAPTFEGGTMDAGAIGTIVSVYEGGLAYDVEINSESTIVVAHADGLEPAE